MPEKLILASRSPQRRAILEQLGVDFEASAAEVEELTVGDAVTVARENARRKALAVPGRLVLGADTVVTLDGRLLLKPTSEDEARAHLETLSGRAHRVVTALCVARDGQSRAAHAATRVRFRSLNEADIDWYLESEEWRDRAGGYAIQGRGAALVEAIEGDYFNVVGLPVPVLLELLPNLLGA